ncbi:DUF968 domain-containing protein [Gilliamella sp. Occ4-3]|uniref:DUF968 domain-containing protein n=1 Tax=Gilliamella sp. Occ4-3 TaxID=3120254 RepID=UPI00080DCE48|nr:DUF968 domain-containing protein [Gilliamella apicola]OCG72975.1 hypothetical protein A9G44_09215 [Gilliamella apicola]
MKAILTPYCQPELGLVILKPGAELLKKLCTGNRIIISQSGEEYAGIKSGIIQDEQPLLNNKYIDPFILHDTVVDKLKNLYNFDYFLNQRYKCQLEDGEYCHHELVNEKVGNSAIRVCWHHNKDLVIDDNVKTLAKRNLKKFLIECVINQLKHDSNHLLSIQELAWWAVINQLHELIPENMARLLHNRPIEEIKSVYKESDLVASDDRSAPMLRTEISNAFNCMATLTKPIRKIAVDPESPESFMLRPKMRRWESAKYTQWVKAQPCVCCGKQADDPHHIIGYGQGKMGGKAHDIFTLPLCREHHNELHRGVEAWEQTHGSQILLLVQFLDRVFGMKVIF